MRNSDDTGDKFAGTMLPGTGGDFVDETDVEGHRKAPLMATEPDGARQRSIPDVEGDDVEGHRKAPLMAIEPDELYRGGPTTQGEVIMRGPGDNPHGDR